LCILVLAEYFMSGVLGLQAVIEAILDVAANTYDRDGGQVAEPTAYLLVIAAVNTLGTMESRRAGGDCYVT